MEINIINVIALLGFFRTKWALKNARKKEET